MLVTSMNLYSKGWRASLSKMKMPVPYQKNCGEALTGKTSNQLEIVLHSK